MFGNFTNKVKQGSEGGIDRNNYSLDEDLAIMDMLSGDEDSGREALSLKRVSEITGRTVASLRYRYKDKKRGIGKLMIEDPTGAAVFKAHDVEFKSEKDAEIRIANYNKAHPAA